MGSAHQRVASGTERPLAKNGPRAQVPFDRAEVVMQAMPLPIAVVGDDLKLVSANRAFHDFFRIAEGDAAGMSVLELNRDRSRRGELEELLTGALRSGLPFDDFEVEYDLPRLGKRIVLLAGRLLAPDAVKASLLLVLEDVTARRRCEEARSERTQRFLNEAGRLLLAEPLESGRTLEKLARMAVPQLGDLCMIDMLNEERSIQPAAAYAEPASVAWLDSLAGRIAADAETTVALVVRSGVSVIHPDLDAAALRELDPERVEVLRRIGARSFLCVPLHGRRGVLGALSLARAAPGRRFGLDDLALAEGLGQRAGLAMENAQLYRAAYDAIRLREEFLGIAAHELRTPLTALKLQLEGLEALLQGTAAPPEEAARVWHKLERSLVHSDRLARLIDSLLVVSRIMRGVLTLQRESLDLSELVREVVERLRPEAARAGCTLDVDARAPVVGRWDPARLEQMVTNLVSNALRYAPGGPVVLRVEPREQGVSLRVEDCGPGIPEARRGSIFERFETAGERSTTGLGLGLYITRQIVEAHGGRVRLESNPGAGATFVVDLPRDARDPR